VDNGDLTVAFLMVLWHSTRHETNVSTKEAKALTNTWFFEALRHNTRKASARITPTKGACETLCVMFPKKSRLSAAEVREVTSSGRFVRRPLVYSRVLARDSFKVGVVLPKKIFKTSVERHKIKRAVLSCVAEVSGEVLPSVHIVIYPQKDIRYAQRSEIMKECRDVLSGLT
jgi:ribonuclease P protein component